MKRENLNHIFSNPDILQLAEECHEAERTLAAELMPTDSIIRGIADADLENGMNGDVTSEQVLFSLECKLHDLRYAINEVKIFRAEYGCLRGTA